MFNLIRTELTRDPISRIGAMMMRPSFRRIKRRLDYEEYGGAPLLGVNGVMLNCHGKSRAKAIASAIVVAERMARQDILRRIGDELREGPSEHPGRTTRVMRKLHIPVSSRAGRREDEA